jgi:hypothetical protein
MLRAYGAGDAAVGESAVRFAAPAFARIDLELAPGVRPGVSTFAHIEAATLPLLEGAPADEIAAGDLAFLSGKTGIPEDQLADFARAHKLAAACGVPAAACFAALRHGLPGDLNGSCRCPRRDLDAALAAALATGLVPGALEGEASGIVNKLIKLRTSHPLRKAAGDEVTFGALLNAAGVSRSVQETFVRLVSLHAGPTEHLWRKVEVHPDGGKQAVADLGFALQAAALARGNLPLVEHLYAEKRSGRVRSLRDLAGLEPVEWRRRLDEVGAATPTDVPGVEDDDKRRNAFAQWISEALEAGFPTAALARRLSRDSELVNSPAAKFLAEAPRLRPRPRAAARRRPRRAHRHRSGAAAAALPPLAALPPRAGPPALRLRLGGVDRRGRPAGLRRAPRRQPRRRRDRASLRRRQPHRAAQHGAAHRGRRRAVGRRHPRRRRLRLSPS